MEKDILFTGHTAVPSDYGCGDGELAQSHNLLNEDGELKPTLAPKVILTLGGDYEVIYIHKTTSYKHYIVLDSSTYKIYWMDESMTSVSASDTYLLGTFSGYASINAVGNTLLIFTTSATNYFLYINSAYKSLGDHVPSVEINFGLRGRPRLWSLMPESSSSSDERGTFDISFDSISKDDLTSEWSDDNKTTITSQVMAKVNKFLSENTVECGRFTMPFLVRYALRLYDGSLTGHSAPILMNPSTTAAPVVFWKHVTGKSSYTDAEMDIMLVAAKLDYELALDNDYNYRLLKNYWTDIVKSVDVFISKPIYTYDQSGECTSFYDSDNMKTKFIGALDFERYGTSPANDSVLLPMTVNGTAKTNGSLDCRTDSLGAAYTEYLYSRIYSMCFSTDRSYPIYSVNLPEFSDDKIEDTVKSTSSFYFLHSIGINDDELPNSGRTDIEVDDDYLQSLSSREVMTDDYQSHDRLIATYSHTYNSRLNLAGVTRELFKGFTPESMLAHCNQETMSFSTTSSSGSNSLLTITTGVGRTTSVGIEIWTYIKENDEVYLVKRSGTSAFTYISRFLSTTVTSTTTDSDGNSTTTTGLNKRSWGIYFFYPNVNAYKMVIWEDGIYRYEVDLSAHDFLSGAVGVLDYEQERETSTATLPTPAHSSDDGDCLVEVPYKLYTSEVNNPYYFPVTGINTIGTGRILGVSTAAKALSQGQFGQFPLYAFTDEGVWALETSDTGGYSAIQPITRDVCVSSESITQIDSSVLFATDRGVMLISGSNTQCVTDILGGDVFFDLSRLPGLASLYDDGAPQIDCAFKEFREDSRMAYDYVNQRIIIYNPGKTYAYAYSMKSKLWGIMESTLFSTVNSYPDAYAMARVDGVNCLVDVSRSDDTSSKGLVVTRPLKLDAPNTLKTVQDVFLRGLFAKGNAKVALYGSRDNINWHLVGSANGHYLRGISGTPYKFFRVVAITELSVGETLAGASVRYTPKLTNQVR